jgi:ABC-type phosphate/phosphonate transport system substrate-binding protein
MVAQLGMYEAPCLAAANDAIFRAIAKRMEWNVSLDRSLPVEEAWALPGLAFAQICGYPLFAHHRSRLHLLGTPIYDAPGCEGPTHRSFLVVRSSANYTMLSDLRGARAAINSVHSNSGRNLLGASIADAVGAATNALPHDDRFFGSVVVTGSHHASWRSVAAGEADVAAIDCVTYTLLQSPDLTSSTRILHTSRAVPGLAFVTSLSDDVPRLRAALHESLVAEETLEARRALRIRGIADVPIASYAICAEMARLADRVFS